MSPSGDVALLFGEAASLTVAPGAADARERILTTVNPLSGAELYVDPNSHARRQAREWQPSDPEAAALMAHIADQPEVLWFGDWNRDIRSEVGAGSPGCSAERGT